MDGKQKASLIGIIIVVVIGLFLMMSNKEEMDYDKKDYKDNEKQEESFKLYEGIDADSVTTEVLKEDNLDEALEALNELEELGL